MIFALLWLIILFRSFCLCYTTAAIQVVVTAGFAQHPYLDHFVCMTLFDCVLSSIVALCAVILAYFIVCNSFMGWCVQC